MLVLGVPPRALAQPAPVRDPGEQAIAAAAANVIKKHGLKVCRAGVLRYDREQAPGYFVFLRSPSAAGGDLQVRYALFAREGKTWAVEALKDDAWRTSCPGTGDKTGKREALSSVVLGDLVDPEIDFSVTFFERELVVTNEKPLVAEGHTEQDWVNLLSTTTANSARAGNYDFQAANLLVLPSGSAAAKTLPGKTKTFVTHGSTSGPGDADLNVHATLGGDVVTLTIEVTDDKVVPLARADASDAEFLKSDHLELWLSAGLAIAPAAGQPTSAKKPGGNPLKARQLGIAKLASGQVHARWLSPVGSKDQLPKVTGPKPGTFLVAFPATDLFGERSFAPDKRHESAFTAAFSDADEPGKKQKALVATSELKWGDVLTFGNVIWLEGGRRFPALPTPANQSLKLTVTGQ
jgi:hypothetical protein